MSKSIFVIVCVCLAGCCNSVMVKPLDAAIIDAARKAKSSGATELSLEMTVTTAYKGTAEVPVDVVTIGGELSRSNSTKATVKIPDLAKWEDPSKNKSNNNIDLQLYLLDTKTLMLHKIEKQ